MCAKNHSKSVREERKQPDWATLIVDAVEKPGVISAAYSLFWNYSVGNQFLAMFQCMLRNIEPGPIHTFRGWLDLGRHVKKGERALTLCMPVSVKRRTNHDAGKIEANSSQTETSSASPAPSNAKTIFVHRPHWFVLAQTEGAEYRPSELPDWSEVRALGELRIGRVPFRHTDGNCQGYASERNIAISPIAYLPHRTLFHEAAHVVLGHTSESKEGFSDTDEPTARDVREVEAECVALICCESLGLAGAKFSRGYIQHWLKGKAIPDKSAQRIFRAADEILRAGRPVLAAG